jgi:rubrerythrin
VLTRTRHLAATSRTALASGVVLATLVVSLGVSVPTSSAIGTSAFCKTLFTSKPTPPPTKVSTTSYKNWAKAALPFYEKLASEAPNKKTKNVLNEIVTILKYEAKSSSLKSLEAYLLTNQVHFTNDGKALATAIIACAG